MAHAVVPKNEHIPTFLWEDSPLDPTARRVEIDEFVVDNVMNNLFLLALSAMQKEKIQSIENTKGEGWFSFYNLGSIHGYPTELWRNVPNKSSRPPKSSGSSVSSEELSRYLNTGYYCTHGSTVFPTWHRCEMATFEQAVYRKMKTIAEGFKNAELQRHSLDALKRYRLPYWDPVARRNEMDTNVAEGKEQVQSMFGMPRIFSEPEVFVWNDGEREKIQNPLYSFRFPEEEEYVDSKRGRIPWGDKKLPGLAASAQKATLRTPDEYGDHNEGLLDKKIKGQTFSLSTSLWQLLHPGPSTENRPWTAFANHWSYKKGERAGGWPENISLESWHDDIHVLVGTGDGSKGHMADPGVASFDPIFFLHHNNIERLFALYQALYDHLDDKFVSSKVEVPNTLGSNDELAPFESKKEGRCYTSEEVRDWTLDYYSIPGLKKRSELNDEDRRAIRQYLTRTYFWRSEISPPKDALKKRPLDLKKVYALNGSDKFELEPAQSVSFVAMEHSTVVLKDFPLNSRKPSVQALDVSINNKTESLEIYPMGSFVNREAGKMRTWNALINVQKYAFGGSFVIQIFIGKLEEEERAAFDFVAVNQVGFSAVFASSTGEDCENCRLNWDMTYEDIVPLTTELPKYLATNNSPDSWPRANLRILEDLEPEHVKPFLQKHLNWRIVDATGNVKTEDDMQRARLKLAVADRHFEFPSDDNPLGTYGEHHVWPEITAGKPGGYDGTNA